MSRKVKTNVLVELQGPGGRCQIAENELNNYLSNGWKRVITKDNVNTITVRAERGNYEIGYETDHYDYLPHDKRPINNRHLGETIFILGDGPSLKNIPKAIFDKYTTIGANRINLHYTPTYQMGVDSRILFNHRNPFQSSKTQKFWAYSCNCGKEYTPAHDQDIHIKKAGAINSYNPDGMFYRYKVEEGYEVEFWNEPILSPKFEDGLRIGRSILLPMINLAYIMGAKQIVLCGIDMKNNNHFYQPLNNRQEQEASLPYPHFEIIMKALDKVAAFLKKKRIKVFNVNLDSAVTCFPFAKLDYKVKIKEVKNGR